MLSLTPTAHVEHIRIHADDSVASGPWRTQDGHKNGQAGLCLRIEAGALARAELERLLPGGHGTPDHYFYEIKCGI